MNINKKKQNLSKKKFYDNPNCRECTVSKKVKLHCASIDENAWSCRKRFKVLKFIFNLLAIGIMYGVYYRTLHIYNKPMFSILVLMIAMCFLDLLFEASKRAIVKIFEILRQRKEAKLQQIQEEEKKEKAQKEAKKEEELKKSEMATYKQLLEGFKEIQKVDECSSKFTSNEYETFLQTLEELCNMLDPKSFTDLRVKKWFEEYLPEFLEICIKFEKRYEGSILDCKEREYFDELLNNFITKITKLKDDLKRGDNVSIITRVETLNSLVEAERRDKQNA